MSCISHVYSLGQDLACIAVKGIALIEVISDFTCVSKFTHFYYRTL